MRQYLRFVNRIRLGHTPLYLEYAYDFSRRWGSAGNQHLEKLISGSKPQFDANLQALAKLHPLVLELSRSDRWAEPHVNWRNQFIPALDGLTIMWAAQRAQRVFIEVGSGNSTIFARRALEHCGSKARLVSIDPEPRVEIDRLCNEVMRKPLERVDPATFDILESGDAIFFDGSHRSFMNSDVTAFMLDVVPRLRPGVLIGIHDVFLPFDYLASWANRGYNEQYLLACYLLANPGYFSLQFCNYWIWSQKWHVDPLSKTWQVLGSDVRDRAPSALWAIKA
jgi:hypothetical protein